MAKEEKGAELWQELPPGTRAALGISRDDKYVNMSEAELNALFEETNGLMPEEPEPVDEDPVVDKEPEEEPEEEPKEEEAEPEPEPEPEKEEAKDEESPLEKRIRLLERRLELEALERQKETEARKRAELLASRQAGRAGYLQQQLRRSAAQPKAQVPTPEAEAEDPWQDQETPAETPAPQPSPRAEVPPQESPFSEDREELIKIAINDEGQEFAKAHAAELESMPQEFLNRLQELMREEAAPYVDEFMGASIKTVRKLARSLMNSAYATARIEFADKLAERVEAEVTPRKAASVEKSRIRKAKAAISSGQGKASRPAPKAKSYEDMSLEELEAEMRKEYGSNYRFGSDKSRHGGL